MTEIERFPRQANNENHAIAFRKEAVRLVESGLSQRVVLQRLGISHATLRAWLRLYGTAVYSQMRRKLFTATQKHQIVRVLLDGRLSEDEALRKYGLRMKNTLREWVAAYRAREAVPPAAPDTPADANALLAAQLRQAQWQIEALHTLIDQAEAAYKIAIRKKGGAKPSK
ncbi:transposase [Hymenobacter arizonensis]|uniref:Helix-turn-helix domain-containing protein n=1 Tax=Hymenobacter arizonensis TaxID=1227077 RepID=A0A1I6BFN1_HYMAR|nr:transposase [Hymenobacter arizonensis]SFQ79711.1 Helix-turn-helix domain-containing protein [Hymenobacter arizonensis]